MLLASRGVGSLGVIDTVMGLVLEVGAELLKAGIAFGTAAYSFEMQKKLMKLTTQQKTIVMQKQAEIDMLLAAQAQEFHETNVNTVIGATVGTTGTLAAWGLGALALVLVLKKGR